MISLIKIFIFFIIVVIPSLAKEVTCKQDGKYSMISSMHLINDIVYKENGLHNVLIEIPTGSRQKWEVQHENGQLSWEFKNKKPREIKFLGYPGNYGFIPQTRSGDGDPLDIIVLSESVNRGDILKIKVIGMLHLEDTGEEDTKIIAIRDNGAFVDIETLGDMLLKYPNVIPIVKEWFEGYKGPGKMLFQGYGTAKEAIQHIETAHGKWLKDTF